MSTFQYALIEDHFALFAVVEVEDCILHDQPEADRMVDELRDCLGCSEPGRIFAA